MITNGICTVFRTAGKTVLKAGTFPCMWQEVRAYEVQKYGEANADTAKVFIPDIAADIRKGDYIFFGEMNDPTDKELYSGLHVHSITVNNFGSQSMRHIMLGVR